MPREVLRRRGGVCDCMTSSGQLKGEKNEQTVTSESRLRDDTATSEIYTLQLFGRGMCVEETDAGKIVVGVVRVRKAECTVRR